MMSRVTLALLLLWAVPARAWLVQGGSAATVQVMTATTAGVVSGGSARSLSATYDTANTSSTTVNLSTVFPFGGTISNLQFRVVGGVTGAQTWQGELVKNGSTNIIGCTVNASTNPCTQSTGGSFATNDTILLVSTPTGTPTNAILQVTFDLTPTNPGDTILPGGNASAFSTASPQAIAPFSDLAPNTSASREITLLPEAGTVDLLTVATNAPGTGSMQYAWNANQNGSASTVTCPIVAAATTCQDATHSFTNVDGDNIEYAGSPSNTPTNGAIGGFDVRWRSSAATNDFLHLVNGSATADSATVTTFYTLSGSGNATEASAQSLVNSETVTKLEVKLSAAPGAGKSRTFTLDDNTSATAISCAVSGASATTCCVNTSGTGGCVAGGPITITSGHLLDVSDVPSGSPASIKPIISLVSHK